MRAIAPHDGDQYVEFIQKEKHGSAWSKEREIRKGISTQFRKMLVVRFGKGKGNRTLKISKLDA